MTHFLIKPQEKENVLFILGWLYLEDTLQFNRKLDNSPTYRITQEYKY